MTPERTPSDGRALGGTREAVEAREPGVERVGTVVVGAGQAGLSVGYHLARRGIPFVILEASERVGDVWRSRWDSLRLFTPARFDGLDGMPFPGEPSRFPTKDEMADYLESYAARFRLPVRTGTRVERLGRGREGRFALEVNGARMEADNVIVAMSSFQTPRVPAFAAALDPDIVQIHSSAYRALSQLREGGVLIVGAGNSGSEIARETVGAHPTWMAGRDVGEIPFRIEGRAARLLLVRLVLRVLFHRVLTLGTPIGRKARPKMVSKGGPLIRVKTRDLDAAGVKRVTRMAGVRDGRPLLEDGQVLDVANVVWCTGFEPGHSWIDLPVFRDGEPVQWRGVVEAEPGLYFVGLHFLYALSSTMIHAIGRDAAYVARHLAARVRAA